MGIGHRWGGTKTVFAACDLRGTVLGLVETGGTNPRRITPRKSAAIIKEGVTALEEQVSLDRTSVLPSTRESLVSHLTNWQGPALPRH